MSKSSITLTGDFVASFSATAERKRVISLVEDFVALRLQRDIREFHTYAVEWGTGRSKFYVDGELVHQSVQAPDYPLQIMLVVFDFPAWDAGSNDGHIPELIVDWIERS